MSQVEHNAFSSCSFSEETDGSIVTTDAVRVAPQKNRYQFSPHFFCKQGGSFVLKFQSKARECLAVAVSDGLTKQKPQYTMVLGDAGNTHTTIQTHNKKQPKVSVLSRVCSLEIWTSYWVCLLTNRTNSSDTRLYVGVGEVPGEQCVATWKSSENDETTTQVETTKGQESVYYIGFGNTAVYDREAPSPVHLRHMRLLAVVDDGLEQKLTELSPETRETIVLHEDDDNTKQVFRDYQEECRKNKARAIKFGIPYQEPAPDAFLPWSQARRLRANPTSGFVTGLNLQDPAEKTKQEARRKRFGMAHEEQQGTAGVNEKECLDRRQAWDNEELVQNLRTDPPPLLWRIPPQDSTDDGTSSDELTMVPEKIHIFSIDWAAFKQIRTNDIMAYFSIYGPSYVEWLGDLSCNVIFADEFSAARALDNLSQEIATPVPEDVSVGKDPPPTDFGAQGWRFCKRVLRKISDDKYGRRGTTARLLMRKATSMDVLHERPSSWPRPPPGFSTKRILGPGSDFGTTDSKKGKRRRNNNKREKNSGARNGHGGSSYNTDTALSGPLSASRSGFTVEEMEAERAAKKAKKE